MTYIVLGLDNLSSCPLQVNDYLNRMEQQVMMQGQEVHKEHQNFGDHHQQINGGRHLIDMDQPLRGYNDESSGPRSELPEDLNFRCGR